MRLSKPSLWTMLGCVAIFLFYPIFGARETLDLDFVEKWGLKGELEDVSMPARGVWLFKGLGPPLLLDTSYCTSWDPQRRYLTCSLGMGQATIFGTGINLDVETSPAPPLRSSLAHRMFTAMRYSVRLEFDESLKSAHVMSIMCGLPVGYLQDLLFVEKLEHIDVAPKGLWRKPSVSLRGAWVRNNYAHGVDQPPGTGYLLLPVLTPDARGGAPPLLNRANLKLAKAKLGAGESLLRWKETLSWKAAVPFGLLAGVILEIYNDW